MRRMTLLAGGAAVALVFTLAAPAAPPSKSGSFANYSLAETTGTTCPGSVACSNIASEPAIRADGAGRFFGSSENGLGGGTVAFRSGGFCRSQSFADALNALLYRAGRGQDLA